MASQPVWLKKYLRMSPEVTKIYNDLDAWLNYCRFNMIKYDEADLYNNKSFTYRQYTKYISKKQVKNNWQLDAKIE